MKVTESWSHDYFRNRAFDFEFSNRSFNFEKLGNHTDFRWGHLCFIG